VKTIFLVRHAKSAWNVLGLDDIDRPLNDRGYGDAHDMASRLRKSVKPDLIISSPAVRALTTALIVARHLHYDSAAIAIQPLLYDTNSDQYRAVIASLPDEHSTVILVGHNPVITETANLLGGTTLDELPTTGIVGVEFDGPAWKQAVKTGGKMTFYDFPKNKQE
jgi:phosphohistidine phosphatase